MTAVEVKCSKRELPANSLIPASPGLEHRQLQAAFKEREEKVLW